MTCDTGDCHAHTGSERGTKISVSVEQWLENHCTRFEDCSYYNLEDMRDIKRKFGLHAKLPLFSDPTTFDKFGIQNMMIVGLASYFTDLMDQ